VEIGESDTVVGQTIDHGRLDGRAVASELCETDVIEHDQNDIGRPFRSRGFRWPPGFRLPPVPPDPFSEFHSHERALHPIAECAWYQRLLQ
jgi:hypothetical protein